MNLQEIIQIQATDIKSPLLFGALGDAYGFCFEFAKPEIIAQHNILKYHQHPEFLDNQPGVYSDDTQMQIALAEIIATDRDWTPEVIAESFLNVFHRDPRAGYAKRFDAFLRETHTASEFLAKINPASERNGAAMRAPIIGMFPELDDVVSRAVIQAKLTHDTKGGVDSAIAAALMTHFFAYEYGTKDQLPSFLDKHIPGYNWNQDWQGEVLVVGIDTVRAAVTSIKSSDSLALLLKNCVDHTGDVDSVATIALASASCSKEFARDIPNCLWEGFEKSDYALKYLLELDRRVSEVTSAVTKRVK